MTGVRRVAFWGETNGTGTMWDQPPTSSIEGIAWPALPNQRNSAILALLYQFEQSQWWTPARLMGRQFVQLGQLASHAYLTVPFYRERLDRAGLAPGDLASPDGWRRLPLLSRADIQSAGDTLITRNLPAGHGAKKDIFTSGSTGSPIRAVRTDLWELIWSAFTLRDHLWHRRDFAATLATIRESENGKAVYPDGSVAPGWGRSPIPAFTTGPCVGLNILTPIDQQVEWLVRQKPDYLLTHPSVAHELARHCLANGIQLAGLREVQTISEILRPATREICRDAWDVPVADMYTTREVGYVALQCPDHDHYHVQAEGVFVEVLDGDGMPCRAGDVGWVVVTALHNFAMPLLRYDIGDHAEVGEPCPCGRGLPVLNRILGRTQNMLVLPSGERRWPLLSSSDIQTLLGLAPIQRYQFVQRGRDHIDLRLETARLLNGDEEDGLRAWVRQKFGYPFDVAITTMDKIPRSAAGKFQDFICEVAEG